ncbi:MAG: tetraacyldisaccharide 4'-kinase [Candidatus Cloacimonetes bacterium]|nr:tetraacyldisaccharide 4'-kinase [Candidatus Cloacimonadota bacterium]
MQKLIEKHLYKRSLLSYSLLPFAFFNFCVQKIRRKFYGKQYRAKSKIISVGNIVSGGSGKTPVTIYLAKMLSAKGFNVAVSHRGYKGKFEQNCTLISSREQIFDFAPQAGDETFLIASKLPGIPVIAGKNRTQAISMVEKQYPDVDYIILDDSFQHLKVAHDYDFIVFNAIGGIGNGFVLPAGILREPISALKYANHIIYNGEGEIPAILKKTGLPISKAKYMVSDFIDKFGNSVVISELKESKIALMSAIGMPKSFENTVMKEGIEFEKHFSLPDHYNFDDKAKLIEIEKMGFDYILITEKDFAKLRFRKNNLPLIVVEVAFQISDLSADNLI